MALFGVREWRDDIKSEIVRATIFLLLLSLRR